MKKVLSILVAMLILITIPASAATAKTKVLKKSVTKKTVTAKKNVKVKAPKNITVTLTAAPEGIVIGQPVVLTASTQKQGSALIEAVWFVNDVKVTDTKSFTTKLDKTTGKYISVLSFNPTEAKEYNISYSIKMGAGKSSVTFVGKALKKLTTGIPKVTDLTVQKTDMKLEEQPLAQGDTIKKYTLAISKINVLRESSTTPVLTDTNFIFKDIAAPTADKPYEYSLTLDGFTKTFKLTLEDFNSLLPQPTVTE